MDRDHNHGHKNPNPADYSDWWDKTKNKPKKTKKIVLPTKNKQTWMKKYVKRNPRLEQKKFSKLEKIRVENKFECNKFNDRPLIPQFEDFIDNLLGALEVKNQKFDGVSESSSHTDNEPTDQNRESPTNSGRNEHSLVGNNDTDAILHEEFNDERHDDCSQSTDKPNQNVGKIRNSTKLYRKNSESIPTSSTDNVDSPLLIAKRESCSTTIEECNESEPTSSKCPPSAPTISLVPLSFLIDPRLQVSDYNQECEETVPDSSDKSEPCQANGSDVDNFKKPEQISRKIVNQVATMNKANIRNVINNPILKFDVALKMQAKKRLREEIRKQLRNINFETRQLPRENIVQPDGFIDPERIPPEVLKQFESVFEVDFGINQAISTVQTCESVAMATPAATVDDSSEENLSDSGNQPNEPCQNNLRTKLLNFEFFSQKEILRQCRQQESDVEENDTAVVHEAENATRHLNDESSVDSSTTTTTNTSNSSAPLPSQQQLKEQFLKNFKHDVLPNLPQNIRRDYMNSGGNEDELTKIYNICLDRLRDSPVFLDTLNKQFTGSTNDEALNFLMENIRHLFAGPKNDSGNKKSGKTSTLESEKANGDDGEISGRLRESPSKDMNSRKKNDFCSNSEREPHHRKEDESNNTRNPRNVPFEQRDRESRWNKNNDESRDRNHYRQQQQYRRFHDRDRNNYQQNRYRWQNARSRSPNRNRRDEEYRRMDGNRRNDGNWRWDENRRVNDNRSGRFSNRSHEQFQQSAVGSGEKPMQNTPNHNQENTSKIHDNPPNNCEQPIHREPISVPCELPSSLENSNKTIGSSNVPQNTKNERLWRSPGEKKCLEPSEKPITAAHSAPSPKIAAVISLVTPPDSSVKSIESNVLNGLVPNGADHKEQDVKEATSAEIANETQTIALGNLKDLDAKLMLLNQKKMELEKQIIELQKEKMEIDLTVMQLQNDRFALISSAVSDSNGLLNANANLQNLLSGRAVFELNNVKATSCTSTASSPNLPPPKRAASSKKKKRPRPPPDPQKKSAFAEALKNRKKRCNRDILIEDAALTLFPDSSSKHCEEIKNTKPSEITAKVNDIFSMPRRSQRPVQVVTPEKPKQKQNLHTNKKSIASAVDACTIANKSPVSAKFMSSDNDMLPLSCIGQSVNIIESDNSDDEVNGDGSSSVNCTMSTISSRNVRNGKLKGFRLPIVRMIAVEGYIVCASEDGNIYKYDSSTRELIATFSKHTESITEIFIDGQGCVFSTSLDGYMKKTTIENFGLELQSVNLHEPLQAISISWNIAFVGSRWGNIFTYDLKKNKLNDIHLCSVGSAITALKATKEGPRRIIIISSKGEKIHLRDAASGLLLRTITVLDNHNICSLVLNGGLLYCGSTGNKVFVYDFTTGNEINTFMCGNGAVSVKIFRNKLLFVACYDGFVYVLNKDTGKQMGRFQGAGKMILALEIIGEKVLTSSKDNEVQIIDIPKCMLNLTK